MARERRFIPRSDTRFEFCKEVVTVPLERLYNVVAILPHQRECRQLC